jgi:hypothetical protein
MTPKEDTMLTLPIKEGDLLYAVAESETSAFQIYSTPVKRVHLHGSYSSFATAELLATAILRLELGNDRQILAFPQDAYYSYEIGLKIHRSAAEALQAFAAQGQARRIVAARRRDSAVEIW